ncbi:hypothetical protein [Candidatus Poriferisodalis sp.]|uniref:hypothetical protein n=1 Tax=Candidatus Poriferisodalis sp. TaxID=3101277 RepID=UPI003B011E9D
MISHEVAGTGEGEVQSLLAALRRAGAAGTRLRLDLTGFDLGNASRRRLSPAWLAVVSNLLVGRFSDLPIRVALPEAPSARMQLLRGAFYFALAQRRGPVEFASHDDASAKAVSSSEGIWAPRRGPVPVLLEEAAGTRLAERVYLYANTHSRAESGYFRRYEGSAAFPFLGKAVPRPQGRKGDALRSEFLSTTCETLAEVLDNISTHAFNLRDPEFRSDWLGPAIVDRSRSCLLVSLTTGGTDSCDRLHFLAFDNGFGIPRTMRWQHPDSLNRVEAADIVECVLRSRLTDRAVDGHNGAGLWCLYNLARFAGGAITVTSEDDLSDGRAAAQLAVRVPAVGSAESAPHVQKRSVPVPWRGTTIQLQVRVPRLDGLAQDQIIEARDNLHRYRAAWPQMA